MLNINKGKNCLTKMKSPTRLIICQVHSYQMNCEDPAERSLHPLWPYPFQNNPNSLWNIFSSAAKQSVLCSPHLTDTGLLHELHPEHVAFTSRICLLFSTEDTGSEESDLFGKDIKMERKVNPSTILEPYSGGLNPTCRVTRKQFYSK